MTRDRDFKKLVRERMARTGERYAAARAQLARDAERAANPASPAGAHPETAALARVLAAAGVRGLGGGPPTEAELLGLGGGLGAAVFTFDYKGHAPTFYVATRCQPQYAYDGEFIRRAAERLGATCEVAETTSAAAAAKKLRAFIDAGPAIVWLDRGALPWSQRLAVAELGAMPHVVVAETIADDRVTVRDTPAAAFELGLDELAAARKRLRTGKHRLVRVTGHAHVDRRAAIVEAIGACAAELRGATRIKGPMAKNFGIAGLRRWAAALVAPKDPKRWTKVFPPIHAGPTLAWGRYWIEHAGTGGAGFRPMYAEFLDGAATVAKLPALRRAAATYRALGAAWSELATALVPDAAIRTAQDRHRAAFARGDLAQLAVAGANLTAAIAASVASPMSEDDLRDHYAMLSARIAALADDEEAAAAELASAVG